MSTRIGLAGVPGSGKSQLAQAIEYAILADEFSGCAGCNTPVEIIDDYVERVEAETDLALGFHASYYGNLSIAMKRANLERLSEAKTIITSGTLLETSTYAASHAVNTYALDDDFEKQDTMKRTEATFRILACLYMDTVKYDRLYYLPPLSIDETLTDEIAEMDRNLQAAFGAFNLVPAIPLVVEGGTLADITEKRLQIVLTDLLGGDDEDQAADPEGQGATAQAAE